MTSSCPHASARLHPDPSLSPKTPSKPTAPSPTTTAVEAPSATRLTHTCTIRYPSCPSHLTLQTPYAYTVKYLNLGANGGKERSRSRQRGEKLPELDMTQPSRMPKGYAKVSSYTDSNRRSRVAKYTKTLTPVSGCSTRFRRR